MAGMRLIDANALKDRIRQEPTDGMYTAEILEAIDEVPTVDAVEVVRCKDCKWYQESKRLPPNKFCYRLMHPDPLEARRVGYNYSPDDFCSYGERMEPNP